MRILSQDGKIDVNYDLGNLSIASGRFEDVERASIYFHSCSCANATRLAEYTSLEKARKAMEMLREEYTGMPSIRRMDDLYGRFKHTGKKDFELFIEHMVLKKCYFQFPADDEVEV